MKRDMDLVREILIKIESGNPFEEMMNLKIDGYDKNQVAYHCELLHQAGYIKTYRTLDSGNSTAPGAFWVQDLTWEGQDFLETIREKTIWENTKKVMSEKGVPMLVGAIKTIATSFITAAAEGIANAIVKNGGLGNAD